MFRALRILADVVKTLTVAHFAGLALAAVPMAACLTCGVGEQLTMVAGGAVYLAAFFVALDW